MTGTWSRIIVECWSWFSHFSWSMDMELPTEIWTEIIHRIARIQAFPKPSECPKEETFETYRSKLINKLLLKGELSVYYDGLPRSERDTRLTEWHMKIAREAEALGWCAHVNEGRRSPPRPSPPPPPPPPPQPPGALIVTGGVGIRNFPLKSGYVERWLCVYPRAEKSA